MRKTFSLKVQQKISVWQEIYVDLEVSSAEEAIEILSTMGSIDHIITELNERGEYHAFTTPENMHDTEEELIPEDNDGQSTFEIYLGDQLMYKNGE